jgi:hypothetical protein
MNPYLASANNAGFSGIQFLLVIKELVINVSRGLMQLMFALVVPALLQILLLLRNNNHIAKAFMMNHPLIQCLLKLPQLWKRGLYLLGVKGQS